MIFGLLYFCVVILCVNRSRSSFILYRIVKRHSRQSNVRRIWTCADNVFLAGNENMHESLDEFEFRQVCNRGTALD